MTQETKPNVLQWFLLEPVEFLETLAYGVFVSQSVLTGWSYITVPIPSPTLRPCSGETKISHCFSWQKRGRSCKDRCVNNASPPLG